MKVTWVTSGPMATVTTPFVRLGSPTIRFGGMTLMSATRVVGSDTSETVTREPYGKVPASSHSPAGTAMDRPATTKVKFVPGAMPVPAALQTVRIPIWDWLVNVTSV